MTNLLSRISQMQYMPVVAKQLERSAPATPAKDDLSNAHFMYVQEPSYVATYRNRNGYIFKPVCCILIINAPSL